MDQGAAMADETPAPLSGWEKMMGSAARKRAFASTPTPSLLIIPCGVFWRAFELKFRQVGDGVGLFGSSASAGAPAYRQHSCRSYLYSHAVHSGDPAGASSAQRLQHPSGDSTVQFVPSSSPRNVVHGPAAGPGSKCPALHILVLVLSGGGGGGGVAAAESSSRAAMAIVDASSLASYAAIRIDTYVYAVFRSKRLINT